MLHCLNCNALNTAGATHCQQCRIPGDFGTAPVAQARVVEHVLVDCDNCGKHAPAQAVHCPSCRWPLQSQRVQSGNAAESDYQPNAYPLLRASA